MSLSAMDYTLRHWKKFPGPKHLPVMLALAFLIDEKGKCEVGDDHIVQVADLVIGYCKGQELTPPQLPELERYLQERTGI